jgi:hypothetical protein
MASWGMLRGRVFHSGTELSPAKAEVKIVKKRAGIKCLVAL